MPNVKLLLAILDGASAVMFESASSPFLDGIALDIGKSRRAVAPAPTITYGNHSCILTGRLPGGANGHGIVGNLFRDPASRRIVNLDDADISNYLQAPTLFETLQGSIERPVVFVSAAEPVTRGAHIVEPMMPYFKHPPLKRDDIAADVALHAIEKHDVDLIVVNFLSVDAAGENFGPASHEYRYAIENADERIREIQETWEKASSQDVHLLVTSDHGMHPVGERFDTMTALLRHGIRSMVASSHRSAHIYLDNPMYSKRARDLLKSTEKYSHVMSKTEMSALSMNHQRSGDIFVLAAPGVELQKDGLRGSHGADTPEETNVPLILGGPLWKKSLKQNGYPDEPKLTDIFALVQQLYSMDE